MARHVPTLACSIALVLVVAGISGSVQAQNQQHCFAETGLCVEGRFLDFWRANGALPVFGYPVSVVQADTVEGRQVQLQWFERTRFELHPENTPPFDVLLGRVGAERLQQLERDWQSEPRESGPKPGCLWFAQTGHNVCNQAGTLGFRNYWQSHGLQDQQLTAFQRSLALFGQPLTDAQLETSRSDNRSYLTQWFERARLEWHPENPNQFKVLLGLLGAELRTVPQSPPITTPTPTPTPTVTSTATPKPRQAPPSTLPIPPTSLPIPQPSPTSALPTPPLPTPAYPGSESPTPALPVGPRPPCPCPPKPTVP